MKYIKTKDGRIIDVKKFIEEEKENPYYTDYEFEEIKNEEDCCSIYWTAIGTEVNSIKHQIGERCRFGATIDSPFIKQADTIEELCDYVFYNDKCDLQITKCPIYFKENFIELLKAKRIWNVKFAILSDKGLIYVAKMNEKGELELC